MIEIGERKCPTILHKVQAHGAGYVRKCAVTVICVKHIALKPTPSAVGADQFVNSVPSLFVVVRRLGFVGRIGNHLAPEKTIEVFARSTRDHSIGDVKIGKTIVIKIPGIARPRPAAHPNASGATCIVERTVAVIPEKRVPNRVLAIHCAHFFRCGLLENLLG